MYVFVCVIVPYHSYLSILSFVGRFFFGAFVLSPCVLRRRRRRGCGGLHQTVLPLGVAESAVQSGAKINRYGYVYSACTRYILGK